MSALDYQTPARYDKGDLKAAALAVAVLFGIGFVFGIGFKSAPAVQEPRSVSDI